MAVGYADYTPEIVVNLAGHIPTGLTLGQLEDPYVLSITPMYDRGTIPAGTYHVSISTVDSTGESWTGDYTVTLTGTGRVVINWVPVWGTDHYNIYFGPTHATASLQTSVAGAATNTFSLESYTAGTTFAPDTNSSAGQAQSNLIVTSAVSGGPAHFFLNLGTTTNSSAAFMFANQYGIVAIFQSKSQGGSVPTGGKSELDVAFNGDSIQLLVPDSTKPTTSLKELDFFVNNVQINSWRQTIQYFYTNLNLTPVSLAGTQASPLLQFTDTQAGVSHAWKFNANSADQLELDHDAAQVLLIGVPTAGQILIADAQPVGRWTTPDGARVYRSAGVTLTSGAQTILSFDSERYNSGGMHSTSLNPSRLTAQHAGKYAITGHAEFQVSSAGSRSLNILRNGATEIADTFIPPATTAVTIISVATIFYLAVGDYVELRAFQDSGGNLTLNVDGNLSIEFAAQWLGP